MKLEFDENRNLGRQTSLVRLKQSRGSCQEAARRGTSRKWTDFGTPGKLTTEPGRSNPGHVFRHPVGCVRNLTDRTRRMESAGFGREMPRVTKVCRDVVRESRNSMFRVPSVPNMTCWLPTIRVFASARWFASSPSSPRMTPACALGNT